LTGLATPLELHGEKHGLTKERRAVLLRLHSVAQQAFFGK